MREFPPCSPRADLCRIKIDNIGATYQNMDSNCAHIWDTYMITTKANRESRFSIRATKKQKELIARAAARSNKTISEFVLENAIEAAEAVGSDHTRIEIPREAYQRFMEILDEPPRSIPALRELFNQ